MPSFDVVSQVDLQEVENAANQARKEIDQRYDFRGSKTSLEWDKKETLSLESSDDFKVKAAVEVLKGKLAKRSVSLKALDEKKIETAPGGRARQEIKLRQGIDADHAKKLQKIIKDAGLKVQVQIQGDQLRITGKKKDDLQAVIQALKGAEVDLPLQFINFRD